MVSELTRRAGSPCVCSPWAALRYIVYQDRRMQNERREEVRAVTCPPSLPRRLQPSKYSNYEKSCQLPQTAVIPIGQNRLLKVNVHVSGRCEASGKRKSRNICQWPPHAVTTGVFAGPAFHPCRVLRCDISAPFQLLSARWVSEGCNKCKISCR